MNQNLLSKLIDIIQELYEKEDSLKEVLSISDINFISPTIEKLEDLIATELGIPQDNTLEMIKKHGDQEGLDHEDCFCRDFISDYFFDFLHGEKTKEELIWKLTNWKKDE
ncbi:hypothetical protein OB236_10845 [Paenibacillus sp. WQ 127069]|uniref:Uncharacterized protein n=1 Tax=Paenibacillus baimaensis TaxID=2982185 RepID=A0ABT2UD93_9BACL|nr:hypothetical protein [Paenibacillus sp. WQ 127069]MCU6792617.1 hypothetical protein [Paenibacillus sp. WQ 127069]